MVKIDLALQGSGGAAPAAPEQEAPAPQPRRTGPAQGRAQHCHQWWPNCDATCKGTLKVLPDGRMLFESERSGHSFLMNCGEITDVQNAKLRFKTTKQNYSLEVLDGPLLEAIASACRSK